MYHCAGVVYQSNPTPTIDLLPKLFQHLLEYQVIVCKKCKYAIVLAQVDGHIQKQHLSIIKEERASIVETVVVSPNIAKTPEYIRIPSGVEAAIKGLLMYYNALRCIYETASGVCNYVCRTKTGM